MRVQRGAIILAFATTLACFGLAMVIPSMHWLVAMLLSMSAGITAYISAKILLPYRGLRRESERLAQSEARPEVIVGFLTKQLPAASLDAALLAGVLALLTVAIPVFYYLFWFTEGSFGDKLIGGLVFSGLVGLGIGGPWGFAVYGTAQQMTSDAQNVFSTSQSAACIAGMAAYKRWLSDERAKLVEFSCATCRAAIVPPETLRRGDEIVCPACSRRYPVHAVQSDADIEIAGRKSANRPVFLSGDSLVLCAGPLSRWLDVTKFTRVHQGYLDLTGQERYLFSFTHDTERVILFTRTPEFRAAVLDRYMSAHPYRGEPICWYCEEQEGHAPTDRILPMHKVLTRNVNEQISQTTIFMTYLENQVRIPRCARCADVHDLGRKVEWALVRSLWIGVAGVVALVAALFCYIGGSTTTGSDWMNQVYPTGPIVLALAGVACLAVAHRPYQRAQSRFVGKLQATRIRTEGDVHLFPRYKALWDEGYREGKKPT